MATIVAGGAGFLGSHLVDRLVASEHVVVFDNLVTGRIANLERALGSRRAAFAYGDVARPVDELDARYRESSSEPLSAIYHLASPASPAAYGERPWETLAANGYGTMQLLELAKRHGARFVYASSAGVYGKPLVHPQPESYVGNVNAVGPRACSQEGKRFGEAAVTAAAQVFGIDARIARLFNGYGPRAHDGDGRLVPALLAAAAAGKPFPICGDGSQTRSLTFVSDLVEGLLLLGGSDLGVAPVNFGGEDEYTVAQIAQTFARVASVTYAPAFGPARRSEPRRRKPALERARSLGWSPRIGLEQGLWETIAWHRFALHKYAATS